MRHLPMLQSLSACAQVHHPALTVDAMHLDFGCVLADTTRRLPVRLTNTGRVDVKYSWAFVEDESLGANQSVQYL